MIEVTETTPAYVEQQREAAGTEYHWSGTGVTFSTERWKEAQKQKSMIYFLKKVNFYLQIHILNTVFMRGFNLMPYCIFFIIW